MRRADPEVLAVIRLALYSAPRTVEELAELSGCNLRSAYRHIKRLELDGLNVTRVGVGRPVRYAIEDAR